MLGCMEATTDEVLSTYFRAMSNHNQSPTSLKPDRAPGFAPVSDNLPRKSITTNWLQVALINIRPHFRFLFTSLYSGKLKEV
jgi:hypothetical protein